MLSDPIIPPPKNPRPVSARVHAKSLQSCLTLWNPMDCRPPGSSAHGIFQARILEWVAMPSSRGYSPPRDQTCVSWVSCIGRQVLYRGATWGLQNISTNYLFNKGTGSNAPTLQGHFSFPSLAVTLISRIQVLFPPWGTCMSQGLQHQLKWNFHLEDVLSANSTTTDPCWTSFKVRECRTNSLSFLSSDMSI